MVTKKDQQEFKRLVNRLEKDSMMIMLFSQDELPREHFDAAVLIFCSRYVDTWSYNKNVVRTLFSHPHFDEKTFLTIINYSSKSLSLSFVVDLIRFQKPLILKYKNIIKDKTHLHYGEGTREEKFESLLDARRRSVFERPKDVTQSLQKVADYIREHKALTLLSPEDRTRKLAEQIVKEDSE